MAAEVVTTYASARDDGVMNEIAVGVEALTQQQVLAVARQDARVRLTDEARKAIVASRDVIEALAGDPEPHYGISTGFGALATRQIAPENRMALQRSLIRSHAAGSGPEVEREVVRALMLLRLSTLATGRTGVRPQTAETYAAMLNAGITPVVHEFGSLGCSGDLAPLAHCALAAMGEGTVRVNGEARPAADALAAAGITPVVLREKEGLALTNGVDGMLGMLTLATGDLALLLRTADLAAAMSVEAQLGTDAVFAADLQALRPHPGQADSAANLRALLAGSAIMASHREPNSCTRVQDAYSLRCSPQVHGPAATRSRTPAWSATASSPAPSTTPSSRSTAGSRATATSTARRSATCSTSSPSPRPTWHRSPNGAPTGCSTAPATTACPRSWRMTRGSTPAT